MAAATVRWSDSDLAYISLAEEAAQNAVTQATHKRRANSFENWKVFCAERNIRYTLQGYKPSEILECQQCYIGRYRKRAHQFQRGEDDIRASTISSALSAIGTSIARLVDSGGKNPFLLEDGERWHVEIRDSFKGYRRADPPPGRQWPVTISMLHHLMSMGPPPGWPINKWHAVQDLCVIAFFFLLRPAEFCETKAVKGAPFLFKEIKIHAYSQVFPAHTVPQSLHDVNPLVPTATAVELMFADQKNGHKGENITLRPTGKPLCPVRAMVRRVHEIRLHAVGRNNQTTSYHIWYDDRKDEMGDKAGFKSIKPDDITHAIQAAAFAVYNTTGIDPKKVSAASFRPGGATALLCGKVDKHTIKLLGRWRSDAIDTYLRTQATSLTSDFSELMLKHGDFSFLVKEDPMQQEHHLPTSNIRLSKAELDAYMAGHSRDMAKQLSAELKKLLMDPPDVPDDDSANST